MRKLRLAKNGLNGGQTRERREGKGERDERKREEGLLLVWQPHKYLFALLLHAVEGQLTWRMRAAAAAVAYRTRNAGACVRLTAATNDKTQANQSRTYCSCCCCCCCSPRCCWRCLCVLIPFDKIMPGITFKWSFGPHSLSSLRTQLSLIYSRPAVPSIDCCDKQ